MFFILGVLAVLAVMFVGSVIGMAKLPIPTWAKAIVVGSIVLSAAIPLTLVAVDVLA